MDYRSIVAKTVAYSTYFSFPLYPEEVAQWLIYDRAVSLDTLRPFLPSISSSSKKKRQHLHKITQNKEKFASQLVGKLRHFPGIAMIAITGSVAVGNPKTNDDIDLMIVTYPNLIWIIRPFFLFFLSLYFRRRHPGDNPSAIFPNTFCPNLWLDTSSLTIPQSKRNLYTAHETLQVKPIYDNGGVYRLYLQSNLWTKKYLANAFSYLSSAKRSSAEPLISRNLLFIPFNALFFVAQYLYMLPKKTSESVSLHFAYFHKKDYLKPINNFLNKSSL